MAGSLLEQDELAKYKCDAFDALQLKLVRDSEDVEDDGAIFRPEMCHQVFGLSETIFGFKNLSVMLYYTACHLKPYISIQYSSRIKPEEHDGVKPDNIEALLSEVVPPGYLKRQSDFINALSNEASFRPMGTHIHSYTIESDGHEIHHEVYKCAYDTPRFREYHTRLQTFLLWYIDGASFIEFEDSRWDFYLTFERCKDASTGVITYPIIGYMTAYNLYAWPDKVRPRISQILILPPFQRQGHGDHLLQAFNQECRGDSKVLDTSVEDPSEEFQYLRDRVDARDCSKLASFSREYILSNGYTAALIAEVQSKLKINKKQCRRLYEIFLLRYSIPAGMDHFKRLVQARLQKPLTQYRTKLFLSLPPAMIAASDRPQDQINQQVTESYDLLLQQYTATLNKLSKEGEGPTLVTNGSSKLSKEGKGPTPVTNGSSHTSHSLTSTVRR